jgi:hypothetical protein
MPKRLLPLELTTPTVTVWGRPNGLPIETTHSPGSSWSDRHQSADDDERHYPHDTAHDTAGHVSLSVLAALSRVRTGMSNNEMTCAMPAGRLVEVINTPKTTCTANNTVAAYASEDSRRFGA